MSRIMRIIQAETLRPLGLAIELDGDEDRPAVRMIDGADAVLEFTPDEARALGIALIEASGLAMGAWGQAHKDRADDAEDDV